MHFQTYQRPRLMNRSTQAQSIHVHSPKYIYIGLRPGPMVSCISLGPQTPLPTAEGDQCIAPLKSNVANKLQEWNCKTRKHNSRTPYIPALNYTPLHFFPHLPHLPSFQPPSWVRGHKKKTILKVEAPAPQLMGRVEGNGMVYKTVEHASIK